MRDPVTPSVRAVLVAMLVAGSLLAAPAAASAANFTVNDLVDDPDLNVADPPFDGVCDASAAAGAQCTLRAALDETNVGGADDTITIAVPGSIVLDNEQLFLNAGQLGEALTINGNPGGTTIDGGDLTRVLNVPLGTVTLNDLRVEDGSVINESGGGISSGASSLTLNRVVVASSQVNGGSNGGAGIFTQTSSNALILNDSTVSGNVVIGGAIERGGGILTNGPVALNRSTVSGNSATVANAGEGGGAAFLDGAVTITNSTISDNQAGLGGGGAISALGNVDSLTITDSTIAGNSASDLDTNLADGIESFVPISFENVILANPTTNCAFAGATSESSIVTDATCPFINANGNQLDVSLAALALGPLQDNGGSTQTRALAPASIAIDAASTDCGGQATDQRGVSRPQGPLCDVGAFELAQAGQTDQPGQPGQPAPAGTSATCRGATATIVGTDDGDELVGTPGADVIAALGGRDRVRGLGGGDLICGGDGRDTLRGGSGKDRLFGEGGGDLLTGGPGKDTLVGGPGKDKQAQ